VLVISRDVLILTGVSVIYMVTGDITIRPSIVSKVTTFLQIVTVLWIMLQFRRPEIVWYSSAAFTVISAVGYIIEGGRTINAAAEGKPAGREKGPGGS
jgi:phosphatidylglycerophosphate synthase